MTSVRTTKASLSIQQQQQQQQLQYGDHEAMTSNNYNNYNDNNNHEGNVTNYKISDMAAQEQQEQISTRNDMVDSVDRCETEDVSNQSVVGTQQQQQQQQQQEQQIESNCFKDNVTTSAANVTTSLCDEEQMDSITATMLPTTATTTTTTKKAAVVVVNTNKESIPITTTLSIIAAKEEAAIDGCGSCDAGNNHRTHNNTDPSGNDNNNNNTINAMENDDAVTEDVFQPQRRGTKKLEAVVIENKTDTDQNDTSIVLFPATQTDGISMAVIPPRPSTPQPSNSNTSQSDTPTTNTKALEAVQYTEETPNLISVPIDAIHCIASFLSPSEFGMKFGILNQTTLLLYRTIMARVYRHAYFCIWECITAIQYYGQYEDCIELMALYLQNGIPIYPYSLGHAFHTLYWKLQIEVSQQEHTRIRQSNNSSPNDEVTEDINAATATTTDMNSSGTRVQQQQQEDPFHGNARIQHRLGRDYTYLEEKCHFYNLMLPTNESSENRRYPMAATTPTTAPAAAVAASLTSTTANNHSSIQHLDDQQQPSSLSLQSNTSPITGNSISHMNKSSSTAKIPHVMIHQHLRDRHRIHQEHFIDVQNGTMPSPLQIIC
jgi:hypothetical protein